MLKLFLKKNSIKDKITKFVYLNRKDIFSVFLLFIIFTVLAVFFSKYLGSILIDCGREAYFPEEMLKGKVLYKDIFNLFGPLSYQINTVFYKLFGISLDSLRFAGVLNSILIIYLLYGISRLFTSEEISFATTLFIIISCVFNPWLFSYILPYAYAMVYALSAFLFSVLFLLLYFKTSKQIFVPLSWFSLGVSITSKYEYILYSILLFIITIYLLFKKKLLFKNVLYSLISFLIVPLISFSILFLQGVKFADLFNHMVIINKFAHSPTLNYFYKNYVGLYPSKTLLILLCKFFIQFFIYFSILVSGLYFSFKLTKTNFFDWKKLSLCMIILLFFSYSFSLYLIDKYAECFSWLPLFVFFILCVIFIKELKNKTEVSNGSYVLFTLISILASIKTFFYLDFYVYGTYAFPLLFIAFSIFIVEYLPNCFKFLDKKILQKSFFTLIIVISFIYLITFIDELSSFTLVKSQQGDLYVPINMAEPAQKAIEYIKQNSIPEDKVWVIPEGIMLNFMTNHPSNGIYYNIIPPYIETYGEEKIISDTKKDPPEYIVINGRNTTDHGRGYICKDYGFKICKYIEENYTQINDGSRADKDSGVFYMTVYKKNVKKHRKI